MSRAGPVAITLRRHWSILGLIPRGPRKIDAAAIERQLENEGIRVTRRSIQRDLEHLAQAFPALHCDSKTKPYGWCWRGEMPLLEMPAMGLSSAVTFDLVRTYLELTLPRSTLKTLAPYFKRAKHTLASHTTTKLARWPSKIRVLPRAFPLRAPDVSPRVLDVVYTALLEERCFKASYRKRHSKQEKEYVVNPLGLVLRDGSLTLVCTFWDYDDVYSVLLHRMSGGELLDQPAKRPRGFDLDAHVAAGGVGFVHGEPIRLEALVEAEVALTLQETPLSADQKLTRSDDARKLLRATVPNTLELRGWLQSYGPLIEVVAPASLRAEMASLAAQLADRYRS